MQPICQHTPLLFLSHSHSPLLFLSLSFSHCIFIYILLLLSPYSLSRLSYTHSFLYFPWIQFFSVSSQDVFFVYISGKCVYNPPSPPLSPPFSLGKLLHYLLFPFSKWWCQDFIFLSGSEDIPYYLLMQHNLWVSKWNFDVVLQFESCCLFRFSLSYNFN